MKYSSEKKIRFYLHSVTGSNRWQAELTTRRIASPDLEIQQQTKIVRCSKKY